LLVAVSTAHLVAGTAGPLLALIQRLASPPVAAAAASGKMAT
jgi:hypothetical protein